MPHPHVGIMSHASAPSGQICREWAVCKEGFCACEDLDAASFALQCAIEEEATTTAAVDETAEEEATATFDVESSAAGVDETATATDTTNAATADDQHSASVPSGQICREWAACEGGFCGCEGMDAASFALQCADNDEETTSASFTNGEYNNEDSMEDDVSSSLQSSAAENYDLEVLMNLPIKKKKPSIGGTSSSLISSMAAQVPAEVVAFNILYKAKRNELMDFFRSKDLYPLRIDMVMNSDGSGENKGYAFVAMPSFAEASRACAEMTGEFLHGRKLNVKMSRKDERRYSSTSTSQTTEDDSDMEVEEMNLASKVFGSSTNFTNLPASTLASTCSGEDCDDTCGHPSPSSSLSDPKLLDPSELARVEANWSERPIFTPTRKCDPIEGWEDIYGISLDQLNEERKVTTAKLAAFGGVIPDVIYYFSTIVEIAYPGDKIFLLLLHCALQLAKGNLTANCGESHALGRHIPVSAVECKSLDIFRELSRILEPFASINMGFTSKAIGAINGHQGLCKTITRLFERCAKLHFEDPKPGYVAQALEIILEHFEKVCIPTYLFSAAGTRTGVNDIIIKKLMHCNGEYTTVSKILLNHIQFFGCAFPGISLRDTYRIMSEKFRALCECMTSHLEKKCGLTVHKSIFEQGCESSVLALVGVNPDVTEESLEKLVRPAGSAAVLAYCTRHPDSPASEGPIEVQAYAAVNYPAIETRLREYEEEGRVDWVPESIDEVMCWHILCHNGGNTAAKMLRNEQEKKDWSDTMQAHQEESRKRKRERGDTDMSKDTKEKIPRVKRRKYYCNVENCTNQAKVGGVCMRHGAKVKRKERKKCSAEDCQNIAVRGGVCWRHGAKWSMKMCSIEGCSNYAQQRGLCKRHGGY